MKTKYISINWFVKGPGISLHNTENQILNKLLHYFFWLQLTYISLISINLPGVFWKTTPSLNCYSTSTVPTFSPFYSFHHAGSEKVHVLLALNIKNMSKHANEVEFYCFHVMKQRSQINDACDLHGFYITYSDCDT